jgi:hypothetical protein
MNYVYLGGDLFMTSKICKTARIFNVFRNALHKMQEKYKELDYLELVEKNCLHFFPQLAYHPNTNIPNLVFQRCVILDKQYQSSHCALFHVKYNGKCIVVKSSEKYYGNAHHKVVEKGLAPHLHVHAQLWGGIHMVIMDDINGLDAHHHSTTST